MLNVTIANATDNMQKFASQFDFYQADIEKWCPTWDPDNTKANQIDRNSSSLKEDLNNVSTQIGPDVVYPLWVSGVSDETCNMFVPGIFWVASVQLFVGLVMLPCQTLCMHHFSRRYVASLYRRRHELEEQQLQVQGGPLLT